VRPARFTLVTLVTLVTLGACASPPPAPKAPPPANADAGPDAEPAPYVGTLVRLPRDADRVSLIDHPLRPDGVPDFGLRVRLSGRVRALYVVWSDGAGRTVDRVQWDTCTHGACPKEMGSNFPTCDQTAAIAVVDARGVLLNPDVELPETTFRDEDVSLYLADPAQRYFTSGRAITLWVELASGRLERTTTALL
jgi:hypothetical protein